ncbi:MAG: ferritin-like domain-containing protein [Pyrinomonadaceae bacterium]|nr:ferritin-like domain-containing protein [Pyrinomonadaceae bacterium]
MNDNKNTILDGLEPEVIERVTRREMFGKLGKYGIAVASAPLVLGALSRETFGQAAQLPAQISDVLNFALTLEYLEDEFYATALKSKIRFGSAKNVFKQIGAHEAAHVALLKSVLGSQAVAKPTFDFTAGGAFADVFTNYQTFLAVAQAFEDTGVRAYKGQAANLISNKQVLQTALQIHSVEARHASQVRRLRGEKGWITGDSRGSLPAPTQAVYNGENNMSQGGADLTGLPNVPTSAITEAFDEPLTKDEVLAIAKLFIKG